jgi:hypothetical protein
MANKLHIIRIESTPTSRLMSLASFREYEYLKTYTAFQYSETNVMHFLFNLLRIKVLYMFRALLAHPQEALGILRACYVSWLHQMLQTTDITRTQYTKCRLYSAS